MGGRHIERSCFVTRVDGGGTMNWRRAGYWTTTGTLAFYPAYFVAIIGFWKVLGSMALLAPGFPRLKEWTYAGIFFNMTGACASHIAAGSEAWHVPLTLAFAALTVASWALRPANRVLGGLPKYHAERVHG